jgi:SAM-dependent methyltransferase
VGVWKEYVFPPLMDRVLRTPEVNARRAKLCEGLYGRVLEIGFGTGLNLRHYPSEVTEVLVVEPSVSAMLLAEPRIAAVSATISHVGRDGTQLDLLDESVDCVLSSYTLCTIPDVDTALLGFIECSNRRVHCISWSTGGHRRSPYAVGSAGCIRFIAASPGVAISTGESIT